MSSFSSLLSYPFSSPFVSFAYRFLCSFSFCLRFIFVFLFDSLLVIFSFLIIISLRCLLSVLFFDSFRLLFISTLLFSCRSELLFLSCFYSPLFGTFIFFSLSLSLLNRSSFCLFSQNIVFSL
jgi:hypothetical protein